MPIDIRMLATTRSMTTKGTNSRKPISNAVRSSDVMNAATSTGKCTSSGEAHDSTPASRVNSIRSFSRTLASMKARNGSSAALNAASNGSEPSR